MQCREQAPSPPTAARPQNSQRNLQKRVTELENALLTIVKRLETNPDANAEEGAAAQTLTQLRSEILPPTPASLESGRSLETSLDRAPVYSLFDIAIRSDVEGPTEIAMNMTPGLSQYGGVEGTTETAKMDHIRNTLLSLFPSPEQLEAIMDSSHSWWLYWQLAFPEIFGFKEGQSLNDFVHQCKASGSVQKLSKGLLAVAISLQETSCDCDAKYNGTTAHDYIAHFLATIDDLVLSNDDLAGTIDGIECMILQAKHESNNGRVRRSWINFRRAVSFAQLLGLHVRSKATHPTDESIRRESIWKALYQGDRYISLLLGLPYSVPEIRFTTNIGNLDPGAMYVPTDGNSYLFRLSSVIGHIIDRNQDVSSRNTFTETIKIEGELMDLAGSMPPDWWDIDPKAGIDSSQLYDPFLPQFWHHQSRALLHLPFMLKASKERRYEFNRKAALEAARGMIVIYRIIRPAAGFGSLICKIIDFQAFTAAMILVLNILGLSQPELTVDANETASDRALIVSTTELLQHASQETAGGVATQAARALEIFSTDRSFQGVTKVAIPYFGTVTFGPGKNLKPNTQAPQSHHTTTTTTTTTTTNNNNHNNCNDTRAALQIPTPSSQSLSPQQCQWSLEDCATMPSEYNFGPYALPQPLDVGVDGNMFANVDFDIDQDWSWFWNNTEVA